MTRIPSKDELVAWLEENPSATGKREIARAFGIKGAGRIELKRLLREMQDEGLIQKRGRRVGAPGALPTVTMLRALGPDSDGDIFAEPMNWEGEGDPPRILFMPRKGDPALTEGDRFLAKLRPVEGEFALNYEARLIKKIGSGPRQMLGIYRKGPDGGRVVPIEKKADKEWLIPSGAGMDARDGELVEAESTGGPRMGLPRGKITSRLGDPGAPKQVSLIALHQHGIPDAFPNDVVAEAEAARDRAKGREDLTTLDLLTIDPADARDHDDAVFAAPDDDPANPGGHVVWVAIADVAAYVRPGTKLDSEARTRGNSTYFPDRVSPMLPEKLSTDLCSLHEGVERPCLAVRMVLNAEGEKQSHRFTRGMMRSRASLSYEQARAAADGQAGAVPLGLEKVIAQLYTAYRAAATARDRRQPLDLDLPERRIELSDDGEVTAIRQRERLDAHRLIEEFMILANVAAAEELEALDRPCLYRVHEEPNAEKIDALRESVETLGLTLAKGQVLQTRHLNDLLRGARGTDAEEMVNLQVLRAQTQAYYSAENFGHFGLHLRRYAHFTSPIRRYADLLVHRALTGELSDDDVERLAETASQISQTERRSMDAERDTIDRYLAHYLAGREGASFRGRISGIARFGLFVKLDETGADGLIPIGTLGREYFHFDAEALTLTGERSGRVLGLGMRAEVRLVEATPVTGGLIFELLSADGAAPSPRGRRRGGPKRKLAKSKVAKAKATRKAKRKARG
ncbi:MAG: ribonuclease R [Pseudomonadota bacterium]